MQSTKRRALKILTPSGDSGLDRWQDERDTRSDRSAAGRRDPVAAVDPLCLGAALIEVPLQVGYRDAHRHGAAEVLQLLIELDDAIGGSSAVLNIGFVRHAHPPLRIGSEGLW